MNNLDDFRRDYKNRKNKMNNILKKCDNCRYLSRGFFHNKCMIKEKYIEYNLIGLFCRYYMDRKL